MIYCNLKGGFGNIMFQISATFEFARKNKVGCSFPNLHQHIDYLQNETFCNKKLTNTEHYKKIFSNLKTSAPPSGIKVINFAFHYVELDVPKNCIIDGFFQSEKYFLNSREKILNLFSHKEESDYVSIHVRRGDYLKKQNFHNCLPQQYYAKAISHFPEQKFLIFSDDVDWCKKIFIGNQFAFFEGKNDIDDLLMMSSCKSNIISNSSFSWWAAWLNLNKEKKIIAPQQWVGKSLSHLDTRDIQCESWIKI